MANRRPVEWRGIAWSDAYQNNPLGQITRHTIVSASDFYDYTKPTVVRLRGQLHFKLNAPVALTEGHVTGVQVGIGVFHEDADQVNPNSMEEDWMYRASGMVVRAYHTANSGAVFLTTDVQGLLNLEVDVRAMRKIPSSHHMLALFVRPIALDGSPNSLRMTGHIRALVKE